ncbi:hypothetical protein [Microbacterium allomyrinae]|uniref:Uncharacterized protein n=1 Tax=Microbacterium allomyrinae TaxID=2830666 RepID=A0A9X1LUN3_9MICO|nr:hypothetical protein [Microbacterium allomyrinae]MCC2031850.1 hypothetical protein [Microbacterium allomyrinae]
MAALLKIATNEKVPVQHRLVAIRDGLDRANLAGTQNIEVGVTKRSFEDTVADVVMDLDLEDDEPLPITATTEDIEDAEIVDEDGEDRLQREDERQERAREREQMLRRSPRPPVSNEERARQEAERVRAFEAGELG